MTRPVRVLQVLSGLGMGGAETWLMELLRMWSRTGSVQTDFLLTGGKAELFDVDALALGAQLHYLPFGRSRLKTFIADYRRILSEGSYDAIHDHADYSAGWRLGFGIGINPPVRIVHVHNPWLLFKTNYTTGFSRRLLAVCGKAMVSRMATHVCGTSSEVLSSFEFQSGLRNSPSIKVLHCGFDVSRFDASRKEAREKILREFSWPSFTRLILVVGRIDRALEIKHPQNHKNTWLSLQIIRDAMNKDSAIRAILVGDGPSRMEIIREINKWGLAERIKLPGIRRDVPLIMCAGDALLFPSAHEGLGMVAVEAQASGLPVLASDKVPAEASIISELYTSLSLDLPIEKWSNELIAMTRRARVTQQSCRNYIEASAYSIRESSLQLESIYRSRLGGCAY